MADGMANGRIFVLPIPRGGTHNFAHVVTTLIVHTSIMHYVLERIKVNLDAMSIQRQSQCPKKFASFLSSFHRNYSYY